MENGNISLALVDNDEMDEIVVVLASVTALTLSFRIMTKVNGWARDTVSYKIRWNDCRFIEVHSDSHEERCYIRDAESMLLMSMAHKIVACVLEMSNAGRSSTYIKEFIKEQF